MITQLWQLQFSMAPLAWYSFCLAKSWRAKKELLCSTPMSLLADFFDWIQTLPQCPATIRSSWRADSTVRVWWSWSSCLSSAECQRRSHKIELWLWQACRGWFHCCRWHRLQKDLTIRWSCSRAAAELCWRLRTVCSSVWGRSAGRWRHWFRSLPCRSPWICSRAGVWSGWWPRRARTAWNGYNSDWRRCCSRDLWFSHLIWN